MTEAIKFASDEAFREAWEQEIAAGIASGKLTRDWTGKADLKTVSLPPEENAAFNKKYGKE